MPCAINALVTARCQGCHGDPLQFGAPIPLFDVADFREERRGTITGARALLYMRGEGKTMPPAPNARATDEELQAFETWLETGMPERTSNEQCDDHGHDITPPPPPPPGTCEESIKLAPQTKYTLPAENTDTYVCYGVDLPAAEAKRQIVAITPTLDNSAVLHHLLVFTASKSRSGTPAPCAVMENDWKMLYGWAPGASAASLPEETGFPVTQNQVTHLVIQAHYSNPAHASGQSDGTGAELCLTTKLRNSDADIIAFGGINFTIDPGEKLRMVCDVKIPSQIGPYLPITLFATFPHMHTLGTRQKLEILPKNGAARTLVEVAPWDFNHQISYSANTQLKVGDTVRTTCEWNNTTASAVSYGEETAEEMCFNFVTYYPKITHAQWSYLAPLSFSSCTTQTF